MNPQGLPVFLRMCVPTARCLRAIHCCAENDGTRRDEKTRSMVAMFLISRKELQVRWIRCQV